MKTGQPNRIAVIAMVHFGIMMGCLFLGLGASMDGFDDPARTSGLLDVLGMAGLGVSMVMAMPGMLLWGLVQAVLPGFFEWPILLLNSVFWGVAIEALLEVRARCFRRGELAD